MFFLFYNGADPQNDNNSKAEEKKRKGRGITKKETIFSRKPDMPKIPIILNDRGQPVGKNSRELSSVIGCEVRRRLSLAYLDWRLIDAKKKYELWIDIKVVHICILHLIQYYDICNDSSLICATGNL